MAEHVGTLLWEMRARANQTLGQLAQQAGISKSALSRWEAGLRQPRVTELEAVLDALDASPPQRALALARIDAPRALRQLRQAPPSDGLGAPLTAGDLLRAMRWRGNWTQEQVASRLGVPRHTLARWELGERLPTNDQMQALCYALHAREEEIIALTSGWFAESPITTTSTNWEEKEVELRQRTYATNEGRVSGLQELNYIQMDREVWFWALREPAARLFLGYLRMCHAHYHRMHQRWELSRTLAQHAQEMLRMAPEPSEEMPDPPLPRLAILQAASTVYGGPRPAPERGISLLSPWVERSSFSPAHQAWILSDIATYSSLAGRYEDALYLAERACRIVRDAQPVELFLRRCDYGKLLIQAGRPEEALRVLPNPSEEPTGSVGVDALLLWAEALGRSGHFTEAHNTLERANVLIADEDLETHRQTARALAEWL